MKPVVPFLYSHDFPSWGAAHEAARHVSITRCCTVYLFHQGQIWRIYVRGEVIAYGLTALQAV